MWELRDARRGTWGHQVRDAGTCGTGTRDVKYRDAGDAGTLMNVSLKYLCLRENVFLWSVLDSIVENHFGYLMMFTQNIIEVSALTIVIRVRLDFHCRVIFPCIRA